MDIEVLTPTATSEAESYTEHKEARNPTKEAPKTDAVKPEPKAEEKPAIEPAADKSEQTDKGEQPKKEKSAADKRFKELTDARKAAEAERDRLRAELEEARKPKTAEPAKVEPKVDDDPRPKLKDFVAKLGANDTYEDAVERFNEADHQWYDRQREKASAKTAAERQQAEIKRTVTEKLAAARAKYPDCDEVLANPEVKPTPSMTQFIVEHPQGMDVAYHLAKNVDDYRRIAALSPAMQISELAYIARGAETEKKPQARAVASSAPPPARTLIAAVAAPPAKSTAEAASLAEHRRLRQGK